jgi:hypothetical protein
VRKRYAFGVLALLIVAASVIWLWRWKQDEPRRTAIHALEDFTMALQSRNSDNLLRAVVLPAAIQGRTAPEQIEFHTKALQDEISAEGLAVLKREGQFGLLTNLFPAEAHAWTTQAGVKPEDCIAFKLERNGLRAEIVLVRDSLLPSTLDPRPSTPDFRIVRCNNVKQLANVIQP